MTPAERENQLLRRRMYDLTHPAHKYTDERIEEAIKKAIEKCNTGICHNDVLVEIPECEFGKPRNEIRKREHRYIKRKVTEFMKAAGYPIRITGSGGRFWLVKHR